MLNKEEENIGYLCGRLFAVLEYTQRKALGIATIAERYYGAAMTNPAMVFPTLNKLTRHHLDKLNHPGLKIYIEKIKLEISDKMPSTGFPARLDLYDQGRFVVGYDHQKSDIFTLKEKENKEDNNN